MSNPPRPHLIYKILSQSAWRAACTDGIYRGSSDDQRDGFIHFSTDAQLAETARRHFSGQPDLLLVAVETAVLGTRLKWEPSRGGALFPHVYGSLDISAARWVRDLALNGDGAPDIAAVLPQEAK